MIKLLKNGLFIIFISVNTIYSQSRNNHIVIKGETIYSISKKYDISIEKIKELNNINNNAISIGQNILIENKSEIEEEKMITSRVEAFASSINEIDESDKYLALHKSADTGTIIFVKNQMNGNIVIVRVIGTLPNTGVNDKIDIRLSNIAFEKLNAKDEVIPVELTYVGKEIK